MTACNYCGGDHLGGKHDLPFRPPMLTFCGGCGCALPDVPEAIAIHERWHESVDNRLNDMPRDYYHMGSRSWEHR